MSSFGLQAFSSLSYEMSYVCKWEKDESKDPFLFKEGAGFTLAFPDEDSFYIVEDNFFKKEYRPCWVEGISSCWFSFEYQKDKVWSLQLVEDNKYVANQNWEIKLEDNHGFVYGSSELVFEMKEGPSLIRVQGDDGENTRFDEVFSCILYVHAVKPPLNLLK